MINITLCMIVKNEEAILADCLGRIAPYVDEIVIADTGSTDRTKEIALRYTDKVYDYVWTDNFSAARNFSISKAGNEYILVLDSDELVESIDINEIKRLIAANPDKVGRMLRADEFVRKGNFNRYNERVNRLFSKNLYQYDGIIHEQVVPIDYKQVDSISNEVKLYNKKEEKSGIAEETAIGSCEAADVKSDESSDKYFAGQTLGDTYPIPLTVKHSGYDGDLSVRKKKTQRNISLLTKALERNPDDPYILYQLGKSYYMEEEYFNAFVYFDKALAYDLNPTLEYVQDMVESYGYSLINSGQYDNAMKLLNIYDVFSLSADFIFLIALIYMNNGKFEQAVKEFLKASRMKECKMEGVNSYLAFYNIGVIYECLGRQSDAADYYNKCGDYEPALKRLIEIKSKEK